ncbi:amidohydrolase [Yaniella flava]|uniref:Amidohydrolase n=1 Tax=Yaniella flava TaxID=287930 RepID=A0ABP5FPS4_9MICC|nr:amidohydrolase [Micrococcaceae bacterium]
MTTFDTLILGDIRTMNPEMSTAEAVAVINGEIAWLGTRAEAEQLTAQETQDFGTQMILPGFVDAHIHPILGAEMARGFDLSEVTTTQQLDDALTQAAASTGEGEWVFAWGLDPTVIADRNICAADIDRSVVDQPVFIRMFDAHSGVVNSRALQLSGVDGTEQFKSQSEVEIDAQGKPTGFLKEWEAMNLVNQVMPAIPFETRLELFLEVLESMADEGITGGQILDRTDGMLDLVRAAEERGELPIRLTFSPWIMPGDQDEIITEIIDMQGTTGRRWGVDGVKLMIDGTIDNGTSWLSYPDINGQSTRPLWLDPASYREVLLRLDAQGIRTTTHAIGDAGVEYVLDVIAETTQPHAADDKPGHRIEHIETLPDRLVPRFTEVGAAVSMQPRHCTLFCAPDGSDNWSQRLGDDRRKDAWRTNSIRQTGAVVAIGSDWPVAPSDPLAVIAEGELRRQVGKPETEPVVPDEALSREALIAGYTSDRARSWGETDRGMIANGMLADFTIFDQDVFAVDADDLPTVNVVATIIGGKLRRPANTASAAR